jgi:exodeoxyribonuclease V alpha subunit
MDTGDPHGRAVYEAAAAVHAGEVQRLVDRTSPLAAPRTPGTLTFRGVEWVDTQSQPPRPTSGKAARAPTKEERATTNAVAEALWHHFDGPAALRAGHQVFRFSSGAIDPADAAALEDLWRLLNRARILTVTRALSTGSIEINEHLHQLSLDRMTVAGHPEFVPGEPVMITANDYQRGLFNGDQGIIVRADEGLGRHHYRAVFRCGGELRPFAIEALRDRLELAWALTVHKSQGSELDAVALLLPHEELPLVTRELIYTGITRARTGVAIAAGKSVLVAGGKRVAQRHSGLAGRLARATARR